MNTPRSIVRLLAISFFSIAALGTMPGLAPLALAQREAPQGLDRSRIVGYLPDWMVYSGYYPKNLVTNGSAKQLTHILYAFANLPAPGSPGAGTCQIGDPWADYEMPVSADNSIDGVGDPGGNTLQGNFNQLLKLKKAYPGLRVSISIGGWTWSAGFSAAASTDASRKAFVSSCIQTFIAGHFTDPQAYDVTQPGIFDGIDIDWEYPGACGNTCAYSPDDTENFTLLLQEFRRQLDARTAITHKHYDLSIAAPAGQQNYSLIQLKEVQKSLTFVNLMTYDLNGGWNDYADHAAPLFTAPNDPIAADKGNSLAGAVAAYRKAGVPADKINAGIPFYGHGWEGVPAKNHGLYQPATGVAPDDQANYNVLQTLTGFNSYYDPLSGMAHWIYNPSTQTFYSYDDAITVFTKALYIRSQRLGGAMIWDITGDDTPGTLLHSVAAGLRRR
jgi:chitinase